MGVPRTIAVSGATSGIGRALAAELANPGRRVALLGRNPERLAAAAAEVRARGAEPFPVPCDVTDPGAVRDAAAMILGGPGAPDLFVLAHGVLPPGPALPLEAEALHAALETNLAGTARLVDALAPAMARAGGGTILLVASMAALHPFRGIAPYAVSKAALDGYARALSADLRGSGVRVAVAYPSIVETPMVEGLRRRAGEELPPVYRVFPVHPVDRVAPKIARGVLRGRTRIFVTWPDAAFDLLLRLFPRTAARWMEAYVARRAR